MNEKKVLFIFTNAFPCDKTLEKYIEHELPYLSRAFKKIYFLPGDFGPVMVDLPENAEALNIYSPGYYKGGAASYLRNFFKILSAFCFELFHTRIGRIFFLKNSARIVKSLNNAINSSIALSKIMQEKGAGKKNSVFYSYWFLHSSLILSFAKKSGYIETFISRGHMADVYDEIDLPKNLVKNFKLKYVGRLFLIDQHAMDYLENKYPEYESKYTVAYLAVKDNGITPSPDGVFRIASCSKYDDRKRVYLIPEILKHINFPVTWAHFGYVPPAEIDKFTNNFSYKAKMDFQFFGDVKNAEILGYYKKNHVDAFINVSTLEGLSVAIIEACSFGIVLIATDTNGTAEIVTSQSGYLIPISFKPEGVAAMITKIKNDSVGTKAASARRLFEERFNSDRNFPAFIAEVLAASNAA